MLAGLVGKDVAVSPGAPVTPSPNRPVTVAVYVDPDMSVNALCVMDLGASAYTGGCPGPAAPRWLRRTPSRRTSELSPMLLEALHEVVNVLSALFNTPGAPHSKLNKLVRARRGRARRHRGHARRLQPDRPRRRGARLRQGRPLARPAVTASSGRTATTVAPERHRGDRSRHPGADCAGHVADASAPRRWTRRLRRVRPARARGPRPWSAGRPTRAWRRRRRTSRARPPAGPPGAGPGRPGPGRGRPPARASSPAPGRSRRAASRRCRPRRSPRPATPRAAARWTPVRRRPGPAARRPCSRPSGGKPTSPSRLRSPARAAGSSATVPRSQRHTSPRPSGSGRNGHASRPIVLAPRSPDVVAPRVAQSARTVNRDAGRFFTRRGAGTARAGRRRSRRRPGVCPAASARGGRRSSSSSGAPGQLAQVARRAGRSPRRCVLPRRSIRPSV